ncbi:hypothetical protein CR513_10291, partial [Mucuna pruriens]
MATWKDLDLSSLNDKDKEVNLFLMANTTLKDEDDEKVTFNNLKYLQVDHKELLSNSPTLSLGYKELKTKFAKLSKDFESLEKENSIFKKENEKLTEEQTNELSKVNTLEVNELQKEVIDLRQSLAKFVNGTENLNKLLKCSKSLYDKSGLGLTQKDPRKFSGKETLVMVLRQWVLTTHDKRRVYVPRPQAKERRIGYIQRTKTQSIEHKPIDCNGYIIFSTMRQNNLYKIDITDLTNQNVTCLVSINNDQWMWYKKLGHASLRLIFKLKKHNLMRSLPSLVYKANQLCDTCQKGKQIRGSFESKNIVFTPRPLELLHIVLFGPTRTASLGKHYGLVGVNNYSRWT